LLNLSRSVCLWLTIWFCNKY